MTSYERIVQTHIEAVIEAGLPGTAELIAGLEESKSRLAKERDSLSATLTKLAMEVHELGENNIPTDLHKKLDRLLKKGDLSAFNS